MDASAKRNIPLVAVAVVAVVAIGFQQARINALKSEAAERDTARGGQRVHGGSVPSAVSSTRTTVEATDVSLALAEVFEELRELDGSIAGMSVEEFGETLAGLIGSSKHPDELAKTALMMRSLDPDTALATYQAYKKARGLEPWREAYSLRAMLKAFGEGSGREGMDRLIAEYPNGISELAAYLSGWAEVDPDGSIAWLNELPEDSKIYKPALKGVYWSVGSRGPQYAGEAFALLDHETMEPNLLKAAGQATSGSLLTQHGATGLDEWLQTLPTEIQADMLKLSLQHAHRRPPGEIVPLLAAYADGSGEIASHLTSSVTRWARSDAEAAIGWATEHHASSAGSGVEEVLARIGTAAGPDPLERWLEANPSHPSAELVGRILAEQEDLGRVLPGEGG